MEDNILNDVLPIMIHVIAPANLSAGYTFEAEIGCDPSSRFMVVVVCPLSLEKVLPLPNMIP